MMLVNNIDVIPMSSAPDERTTVLDLIAPTPRPEPPARCLSSFTLSEDERILAEELADAHQVSIGDLLRSAIRHLADLAGMHQMPDGTYTEPTKHFQITARTAPVGQKYQTGVRLEIELRAALDDLSRFFDVSMTDVIRAGIRSLAEATGIGQTGQHMARAA